MSNTVIVGSMTLPFSLSNKERLLWFEEWMYESITGVFVPRTIELIFLDLEEMEESMKYMQTKGYILAKDNYFIAPNATLISFNYDQEGAELLNSIKNDKKRTDI